MQSQSQQKTPQIKAPRQTQRETRKNSTHNISQMVAAMLSQADALNLPQLGGKLSLAAGELGNQAAIALLDAGGRSAECTNNIGKILSGAAMPQFADNVAMNTLSIQPSFETQSVPQFFEAPVCDFSAAQAVAAPFA